MNLSPLLSTSKSLLFVTLTLTILWSCKKEKSEHLVFKTPEAYPGQNVQPTAFTANWEKVAATSYILYVATDSNFVHPLPGYNPLSVRVDSARLTGLTSKADYYYKVQAISPNGDTTDFSNTIYSPTPDPNDDRFVYVGSQDTYLYCFYAGTGAKVWSFKTTDVTGDIMSTPTISDGLLYFGGTNQRLYALDPYTGVKRWEFRTGSAVLSSPCVGPNAVYISSFYTGTLFGVNKNSSQKWAATPSPNVAFYSSPAYSNGMVYIGSPDRNLYAYNSETGAKVWSASCGDSVVSSPAISNGIVYVGSFDHYLYAFDAASGALKWRTATSDSIASSPTIANGIVYFGSYDQYVYALDANTGVKIWKSPTTGRIGSSPFVANGIVYIGSFDNKVYAFDAATGAQKWATATGARV